MWKRVFIFFFKTFLSLFASKTCFYLHLTAHRRRTLLIPECVRLPDIATKRRQHVIIAIWNVTTVLHAWGTGFWHILTLRRCFQLKTSLSSRTGNEIHCPVRLMTVFIVNGFFVTEKSAGTLWLRDVVHLSCSHSHFTRSAQTVPMTRSLWPEAPRVLFIAIKSAGPNVSASSLAGIGDDARLNHHLALRRSHLAISVCQADRGVKPTVQDGSSAHTTFPRQQAHTECNHFGWSTAERVRTPAVGSTLHISLQQHFFFLCD